MTDDSVGSSAELDPRLVRCFEEFGDEKAKLGGWCEGLERFVVGLRERCGEELRPQLQEFLDGDRCVEAARHEPARAVQVNPGSGDLESGSNIPITLDLVVRSRFNGGGMGTIYEVEERALNRVVALKVMRQTIGTAEARERFIREAEITSRINHPAIVPIFGLGETGGLPCYAMKLLGDRRTFLDEIGDLGKRRPGAERIRLLLRHFREVCRAVENAHRLGYVHCDLTPKNLAVDGGEVYVLDWGLARDIGSPGPVGGTDGYMAPEAVLSELGVVTPALDVYSLGAVLAHILTGQRPTKAHHESPGAGSTQINLTDFPPSRTADRSIPKRLRRISAKAMMRAPSDRFASAAALGDEIGRWLESDAPVLVPESRAEWMARALRKHPLGALATVVMVLLTCWLVTWARGQQAEAKITVENERISKRLAVAQERAERQEALANAEKAARVASMAKLGGAIRTIEQYQDTVTENHPLSLLMKKPQNELILETTSYYREYAEEARSYGEEGSELLTRAAVAQLRSAMSLLQRRDVTGLEQSISRQLDASEAYFKELLLTDRANPKCLSGLGTVYRCKADLALREDKGDGEAIAQRAIDYLNAQLTNQPDDIQSSIELGLTLDVRSRYRYRRGLFDEARRDTEQAVKAHRQGIELGNVAKSTVYGVQAMSRRMLALSLSNLASFKATDETKLGLLEEALTVLRTTKNEISHADYIGLYRNIVLHILLIYNGLPNPNHYITKCREWISELDGFPQTAKTPKVTYTISTLYNQMGMMYMRHQSWKNALTSLENAGRYHKAAYALDPTDRQEIEHHWKICHNKAVALYRLQRHVEAFEAWSQSLLFVSGDARNDILLTRTNSLVELGRVDEVVAEIESLPKMSRGNEYDKACIYARLALMTKEPNRLAGYASKSIGLLRDSAAPQTPEQLRYLMGDPTFNTLRSRVEFRELLTELIFRNPFMAEPSRSKP
jgi:tetratricopeptide (TPR) repeat protein